MRWRGAVLFAAIVLGGCAATQADGDDGQAAEMAEALAGRTAGTAARCIDPGIASGPRVIGDALLYRDGRRLWVSRAVDGCPSLRNDAITIVEVYGGQVCQNDRFRTVDRGGAGIPGPYCRFGPFVPFEKPRS